jgi:hypothetical protein
MLNKVTSTMVAGSGAGEQVNYICLDPDQHIRSWFQFQIMPIKAVLKLTFLSKNLCFKIKVFKEASS